VKVEKRGLVMSKVRNRLSSLPIRSMAECEGLLSCWVQE
jgi:hypothetical protein